jgi:hypothetical protein
MPKATGTSRTRHKGRVKAAAQPARGRAPEERESHTPSPTAVAAEAQRTGVVPLLVADELPDDLLGRDDVLRGADQRRSLDTDDVGDLAPGGSMLNPDLNRVDDIGRAVGVAEEDSGALVASADLLDRRDQRRAMADLPEANPVTPVPAPRPRRR